MEDLSREALQKYWDRMDPEVRKMITEIVLENMQKLDLRESMLRKIERMELAAQIQHANMKILSGGGIWPEMGPKTREAIRRKVFSEATTPEPEKNDLKELISQIAWMNGHLAKIAESLKHMEPEKYQ